MSAVVEELNVPLEIAEGTAFAAADLLPGKSLQVTGTFTATLLLQRSNDGDNWTTIGDNITAAAYRDWATQEGYLRINVTAYTSGTPVATLSALRQEW